MHFDNASESQSYCIPIPKCPAKKRKERFLLSACSYLWPQLPITYPWQNFIPLIEAYFLNFIFCNLTNHVIFEPSLNACCLNCFQVFYLIKSITFVWNCFICLTARTSLDSHPMNHAKTIQSQKDLDWAKNFTKKGWQ